MLLYVALTALEKWPLTIPPKPYNCTKFINIFTEEKRLFISSFSSIHAFITTKKKLIYKRNTIYMYVEKKLLYRKPITPVTIPFNLFKLPVIKNCWWCHGLLNHLSCVCCLYIVALNTNEFSYVFIVLYVFKHDRMF